MPIVTYLIFFAGIKSALCYSKPEIYELFFSKLNLELVTWILGLFP